MGFKVEKEMDVSGPHFDMMKGLKDVPVTTIKMATPERGMARANVLHRFHIYWNDRG